MKIAIFSQMLDTKNGYGNITYELCRNLKKKGVDFVLFLSKSEKGRGYIDDLDIDFEIRYELPEYIYRVKTPKFFDYFKNIDLSGFSLVHSLFSFPYSFMVARVAKKNKLPFIMGAQGTFGVLPLMRWPDKYFLKWSYKRAKEILVPSEFTRKKILEYSGNNYNISVIHNGVNYDRFSKKPDISDLREKYKDNKIILTVGGIKLRKGQDLVIKAIPEVLKRFPSLKYLIIGGKEGMIGLESLIKKNGLKNNVEFLGHRSGIELVKYFYLADLYVHTPRFIHGNFEGFGIVYLEAGACGKPSVATDAGGIRDAVVDEQTGIVVGDEDIEGISSAVIRLLLNGELRNKLGEGARKYAKNHDWSVVVSSFIEKYKGLSN